MFAGGNYHFSGNKTPSMEVFHELEQITHSSTVILLRSLRVGESTEKVGGKNN